MQLFKTLAIFAATAILPASARAVAAPPGVMQWQTLGSPFTRDCGGTYLSTIGWRGQPGVTCASLQWNDPTLHTLNYLLGTECAIQLYSEEGCEDDTRISVIDEPTNEHNVCIEVPAGYRALSVTCDVSLRDQTRHPIVWG